MNNQAIVKLSKMIFMAADPETAVDVDLVGEETVSIILYVNGKRYLTQITEEAPEDTSAGPR